MNNFGLLATLQARPGKEAEVEAHVTGEVAKALFGRAEELFATAPQIQQLDLLAEKV